LTHHGLELSNKTYEFQADGCLARKLLITGAGARRMTISLLPSIDYTCDPSSLFPRAEAPSEVRLRAPLAKTRARRPSSSQAQADAQREQEEREQRRREAFQTKELIEEYAPLVRQIVGGFQRRLPRNVLRDDLLAAGMAGLWDAIRRHQTERTVSFEWYVRITHRGRWVSIDRAKVTLPIDEAVSHDPILRQTNERWINNRFTMRMVIP
jgi:hypothetical protein